MHVEAEKPFYSDAEMLIDSSEGARERRLRDADVDDYRVNLPNPVDGTCQWLLSNSQFETWIASEESALLWITGYPGSGKIILSASITDHLEGRHLSARREPRSARSSVSKRMKTKMTQMQFFAAASLRSS